MPLAGTSLSKFSLSYNQYNNRHLDIGVGDWKNNLWTYDKLQYTSLKSM
jgi:hypothetical protein